MKIKWITTTKYPYSADTFSGGSFYDYLATHFLGEEFNVELIWIKRQESSNFCNRVINEFYFINELSRVVLNGDINIRTHFPVAFAPYKNGAKNIAIIHQFYKGLTSDSYYLPYFFKNLKKNDKIVTVSRYWQDWFQNKGHKNVEVIYNPFNIADFNFPEAEIHAFKRKYDLPDYKPIIYIGSTGRGKGVEETYSVLKDLDVHLVSSGRNRTRKIIPCLNLNHREYLCLLKSSTVAIQMSQLEEGWCRVLHEAMLCKTPVIGSGRGGMEELIIGGGQIICRDFRQLKSHVKKILDNTKLRNELAEKGYEFAKRFTYERFKENWIELINSLIT